MTSSAELIHKKNINKMEQIFYEGCKTERTMNLGVELEHFIVRKDTKEALPYQGEKGIHYILKMLLESYPDARGVYEIGKGSAKKGGSLIFGLETDQFALSLEPAAQLEISISPGESIQEIEKIYRDFREHLDYLLKECGAECLEAGYQPKNKAEELSLIPKERYQVMDAYFANLGNGGREMMRATASTQVSIDYNSCSDFRKKFQAAYILTPVFQFLTDNTPVYEGEKNNLPLRRNQVWSRVDKKRTGIIPGVLSGDFSFRDYAEYLWNMPLMYCPRELMPLSFIRRQKEEEVSKAVTCAVGDLTPAEIWKEEEMSQEAVWHVMSMVFPDVRLKNYIEIRGADSMSMEKALGYVALIKGLLYQTELVEKLDQEVQLQNISEYHVQMAKKSIQENGKDAVIYRENVVALCNRLIEKAHAVLSKEEKKYLESMLQICR